MLLSLSSPLLLLLTTGTVLSVPRQYSRPEKAGFFPQFSRLSNLNYLPPEDQVGDWNTPWTFSPTFPRVVPPSSDMMQNFALTPVYQALSHHRQEDDSEPVEKRANTDGRDLNRLFMMR